MRSNITERLRAAGLRITPQRVAVLKALAEREDHPTAETLWRAVAAEMPWVARATVYATLKRLTATGNISLISTLSGAARYDFTTEAHPHLICRTCGKVEDLEEPIIEDVTEGGRRARTRKGFRIDEHHINFIGTCGICWDTAAASDEGKARKE